MRERFVEQKHMYESSESARIGEKQAYVVKFTRCLVMYYCDVLHCNFFDWFIQVRDLPSSITVCG